MFNHWFLSLIRSKVENFKTDRGLSLGEALKPGIPLFTCFSLFTIWAYYSPSNILQEHPRLFITSLGIVFSNITVCNTLIETLIFNIIFKHIMFFVFIYGIMVAQSLVYVSSEMDILGQGKGGVWLPHRCSLGAMSPSSNPPTMSV